MEWVRVFLIVHIIAGSTGLLSGTFVMLTRKGDKRHRLAGKIFAWSMLVSSVFALLITAFRPKPFLTVIALFTIYMTLSGWLAIRSKERESHKTLAILGWMLAITFGTMGSFKLIDGDSFGVALIVFAFVCAGFARSDYRFASRQQRKSTQLHLQRMSGAYISSATAFLVVNAGHFGSGIPALVFWLLPTLMITPLIVRWSRIHKK